MRGANARPLANKNKLTRTKHNCYGLFFDSAVDSQLLECRPRDVCAIFQSAILRRKSQSNLHKICFLIRYSRQPEVRGPGARRIRDDGQHGGAKVSGKEKGETLKHIWVSGTCGGYSSYVSAKLATKNFH